MRDPAGKIVLGSRSPRRLELLRLIVPAERVAVVPPSESDEPGFEDATSWPEIERRLLEIARAKCDDVLAQVAGEPTAAVITADTVIVAEDAEGSPVVLGQPPEGDLWREVVRGWFENYLLGKEHTAASGVRVAVPNGRVLERVVKTRVAFDASAKQWLDWYLATEEPRGKAGGYALQGAGSLFVSEIHGSPSNVVGLPIREVKEMLEELGL